MDMNACMLTVNMDKLILSCLLSMVSVLSFYIFLTVNKSHENTKTNNALRVCLSVISYFPILSVSSAQSSIASTEKE